MDYGENIFIFNNLANAKRLKEYISRKKPKTALILGSKTSSIKLAEAFNKLKIDTYLMEKNNRILKSFDKEISELLELHLNEYITVITEAELMDVKTQDTRLVLNYFKDNLKQAITVDMVIVDVKNLPPTRFLKNSGIATDKNDYVIIDEYFNTNIKDIYAIGEATVFGSNKNMYKAYTVPSILKQVQILSNNIIKEEENENLKSQKLNIEELEKQILPLNAIVTKIFGIYIGNVGYTETDVKKLGIAYYTEIVSDTTEEFYKKDNEIILKGIFEKGTNKLLGASCIGKAGVEAVINSLSVAIEMKLEKKQLINLELAYIPKYSNPKNIINMLGIKERRK